MTPLLLIIALQHSHLSTESVILELGFTKSPESTNSSSFRAWNYRKENPPYAIKLQTFTYEGKESRFAVIEGISENSQYRSKFDSRPRILPNENILGFETIFSPDPTRTQVYAFANHCYINVVVSGLLLPTGKPGEVKEAEPSPTDTAEKCSQLATLFLAEQEAEGFSLEQSTPHVLRGLDGTRYISITSYAQSKGIEYVINPETGAGKIHSTPPIAFNLGSRHFKVGEEQRTAEHIVVLQDGIPYIPESMLPR